MTRSIAPVNDEVSVAPAFPPFTAECLGDVVPSRLEPAPTTVYVGVRRT
jgi:hypothetical protein